MAAAKDCHILTNYYMAKYKDKYGIGAIVNAHKARWGFDNVLMSVTLGEAKRLLDFYMDTQSSNAHDLEWFFYNYDKLQTNMARVAEDEELRRRLRQQTKERVEQWKERRGIN